MEEGAEERRVSERVWDWIWKEQAPGVRGESEHWGKAELGMKHCGLCMDVSADQGGKTIFAWQKEHTETTVTQNGQCLKAPQWLQTPCSSRIILEHIAQDHKQVNLVPQHSIRYVAVMSDTGTPGG